MEWVVDTVLPREVQKLASTIEEKDSVIALMNDDLQGCDNQIQAIKYENGGIAYTKGCVSSRATKMSRHHHPS